MLTVIVDTDVAIDYLRGIQYANELMLGLWDGNTAYLSILSAYELYAGMRENEIEDTGHFIDACILEPVTIETARKAGEIYRRYRKEGLTLTSIDCLVNATAVVKGHKIATKNKEHYPDKKILLPLK
ncbi:MAG: PIN domain-containing protein [Nitrospirae bacterium]|nr:PIN domain-containing protein [Nitrospirota bacterium]